MTNFNPSIFYTGKYNVNPKLKELKSLHKLQTSELKGTFSSPTKAEISKIKDASLKKQLKLYKKDDRDTFEKEAKPKKGKVTLNTDIEVIPGASIGYLEILKSHLLGEETKYSKPYQKARKQLLDSKKLSGNRTNKFFGSDQKGVSTVRLIALHKASKFSSTHKIDEDVYTVCFGGHFCDVLSIEGDHAYDETNIIDRLNYHFPDIQESLDSHLKMTLISSGEERPNMLLAKYVVFDARNIIGMCRNCNGQKKGNTLGWLLKHPRYGADFLNLAFPLNYSTIIPRTKDGMGLADAMMVYFFNKHAALVSLNTKAMPADSTQMKAIKDGKKSESKKVGSKLVLKFDEIAVLYREFASQVLDDNDLTTFDILTKKINKNRS